MVHIIWTIFKDQVSGKVKVVSRSLSNLNSISIDTPRKFHIFLCRNDEKGLFLLHSKIISDLYTWYLIDSATINGELHLIQNEHMQLNSQLDLNFQIIFEFCPEFRIESLYSYYLQSLCRLSL